MTLRFEKTQDAIPEDISFSHFMSHTDNLPLFQNTVILPQKSPALLLI